MTRPTRAVVDLAAIRQNVRRIKARVGAAKVLIAVKADAYGHGVLPVSVAVLEAGAEWLGVAFAEEGVEIRRAGIEDRVLVFGALLSDDVPTILEHNLTPALSDVSFAEELSRAAVRIGRKVPVHANVDTGMGRVGFVVSRAHEEVLRVARLPGLQLEGIMTHFPSSDEGERSFTLGQLKQLTELVDKLRVDGVRPPMIHTANTGGVLDFPESFQAMVRVGIGAYGYYPSAAVGRSIELVPSLELVTRIVYLKSCPSGTPISYGRTFVTRRPGVVATLPLGYADGYRRELSNQGRVSVVSGPAKTRTFCPVIGRVCMDQVVIDVTEAPGVAVGDEVIVYSRRREDPNSVEAVARMLSTIPHEVTCGLSKRVPRTYISM